MGVKGLKSGKGVGLRKDGGRVGKVVAGKRRLEGKDVRWVCCGKVGVVRGLDGEQEFGTGLVKNDEGWSNGSYEVIKGGVEVDMIGGEKELDLFEEAEELVIGKLVEECGEGKDVVRLSDRKGKGVERSVGEVGKMFEKRVVEEISKEVKRFRLVGEEVIEEEEDEEGVDSLEAWKLKKVNRERREKEERKKREKEGMVARGKELGRGRDEVKKLWSKFRDWKEEVEEVSYIWGKSEEKVRSFSLDMEIRRCGKEWRELVSAVGLGKGREGGDREVVRSEVVVPEVVKRLEVLKEKVVVLDGRSYGEVLKGVEKDMNDVDLEILEGKKEEERKVVEGSLLEKEGRMGRKVEVILDSQEDERMEGEGSGSSWDSERVEEVLGLKKGDIVGMVRKKGRMRVELKEGKVVGEGEKVDGDKWVEAIGEKVKEVKNLDTWAGMVIPVISVDRLMGKMGELKEELEGNADIQLMKDPVWLLPQGRIRDWRLREVGVLVHVVRESKRVKWLGSGLMWRGLRVKVNRYVGKKEVEWCTKCAGFGHSWWNCEGKVKCSVCAVEGQPGWQHRCECGLGRVSCVHYRKCGGCGGRHTMKEASVENGLALRIEWRRLKSLY